MQRSFSALVATLRPSPIQEMAERTRRSIQQGNDVVDMTLGEPDFPTPEHIAAAAIRAIAEGQTRYTPINGTVRLREAIAHKFHDENAITCTPTEISVACGGKQVIYQAFLATLRPGDEVVVPTPYWASYADIVQMNGGTLRPVVTAPESGYALQPEALESAITAKTRWLVLNSPSNPSGTAYTQEQLLAFADVIRRCDNQDFLVLADDIYEHIRFDDVGIATFAALAPDLRNRVLTVNGVSKAYSMTGWRVGYACGPDDLVEAMTRIQMQVNSHTSSVSQAAAVAALEGPQDEVRRRCAVFRERRDLMLDRLGAIPGVRTPQPQGAFYLFPDVRDLIGRRTPEGATLSDDVAVASYLLREGVAVVPGSGFGMPGFLRLSYATCDEKLHLAADRIGEAVEKLA